MNNVLNTRLNSKKLQSILQIYNYKVKKGDILAGLIIGFERNYVIVNLGVDKIGFLPINELVNLNYNNFEKNLKIGSIAEFSVINCKQKIILSLRSVSELIKWDRLKQVDFKNTTAMGKIIKSNWSGKVIDFRGLKMYVPYAHLPKFYRRRVKNETYLPFKFLSIRDTKINVSTKLSLLKKQNFLIKTNTIKKATIVKIKPFGVFVNISGITCLLHISEISYQKIKNLSNHFNIGDVIEVKIIYVNINKGRVAVSKKQLP